jgi:hypothetical protein
LNNLIFEGHLCLVCFLLSSFSPQPPNIVNFSQINSCFLNKAALQSFYEKYISKIISSLVNSAFSYSFSFFSTPHSLFLLFFSSHLTPFAVPIHNSLKWILPYFILSTWSDTSIYHILTQCICQCIINMRLRYTYFSASCFLFFFFIVVLGGGTLWHLQRFLQCIKYIILELTPSTTFPYPSSPDFWNSLTSIIFAFTYICTHFFSPYSLVFLTKY